MSNPFPPLNHSPSWDRTESMAVAASSTKIERSYHDSTGGTNTMKILRVGDQ